MNRLAENEALRDLRRRLADREVRRAPEPAERPAQPAQVQRSAGGPLSPPARARGLCHKAAYRSRGAAEAGLRSLVKRGLDRPENGRLHVYYCQRCLRFHVGHSDREES